MYYSLSNKGQFSALAYMNFSPVAETYSESGQTSKMELFAKIVNG